VASGSVARRYARALLSIGVADGQFENYAAQLGRIQQAYDVSPELRDLWLNPANDRDRRLKAIDSLVGPLELSPSVANTLRLLVERQRLADLPAIVRAYNELVDEKSGRVQAVVTSAVALTAELTGEIAAALATSTKKQIVLETKVDPSLIGGIVTRVGGTVLDGSLKTQLEQLRTTLRTTRV
jgi:F-type H+-transporting ATPase subunit delta